MAKQILYQHDNFDYETTKRAFQQELEFVLLNNKLNNKVILNKKSAEHIISDIQKTEKGYKMFYKIKYYVANENGRNILCNIFWPSKTYDMLSLKQILSIEEMFDVIAEMHLRGMHLHGMHLRGMHDRFTNCNIIPSLVRLFSKACNCCCTIERPRGLSGADHWFRTVGEMGIIIFYHENIGLNRIFVYIERNTNFILLRPLESTLCEEVANELISIFCDFGPPQYVDFKARHFFNKVLKILESVRLPFQLPQAYINCKDHKIANVESKVTHKITEWIDKSKSKHWQIGAHVVQWEMNTSEVVDTYIRSKVVTGPLECPYHALFGRLPLSNPQPINRSTPEVNNFPICSQCHKQVYKVYECHFCQAICHFMCCRRVVIETSEMPILINRCNSCEMNV